MKTTDADLSTPRLEGINARRDGKPRETPYRGAWGRAWLEGWDKENARADVDMTDAEWREYLHSMENRT